MLSRPQKELIAKNESVRKLSERMVTREGKSSETLRRYLEGVLTFTAFMQCETPDLALEKLKQENDVTEKLDQYIGWLLSKGFTPINLKAHWFGVKKWITCNRISDIEWGYISKPKVASQIRDRIPSREELRLILSNKVSLRDKSFFMVALSSGLRIGTLPTLKVEDYSALENLGMITVEGGANRKLANGKSFFTFITPETRKVLEDYLATRKSLKPQDPLFAKENGKPLSAYVQNISRQWRRLLTRANLQRKIENHKYTELHGHVLRKFFQTNCKLSGCRADFVDYWLGHHPVKQEEYLNDSYFRPSKEAHVQEYRKAIPSLTIFESTELETLKSEVSKLEPLIRLVDALSSEDLQIFSKGWSQQEKPQLTQEQGSRSAEVSEQLSMALAKGLLKTLSLKEPSKKKQKST